MSSSSVKLSLMTCQKYLNCDTYCSEIPPIVNTGKEWDIILSRRLGVKTIHTVFLKLHVISKSIQCLSNLSKSNLRAAHVGASRTKSSAYASILLKIPLIPFHWRCRIHRSLDIYTIWFNSTPQHANCGLKTEPYFTSTELSPLSQNKLLVIPHL